MNDTALSPELVYLSLVFGLFVVPKYLQRFRIPGAITSLVLGFGAAVYVPHVTEDATIRLLSTMGIVALFLFAGLEIDFEDLRRGIRVLGVHVGVQLVLVAAVTGALSAWLEFPTRTAAVVALALLTPSTGFILDSLPQFGLTESEVFWVKSKAIATEIVALAVLFVVTQSADARQLATSSAILALVIVFAPLAFLAFARWVLPYAPRSEFAFVVIVALICAYVTRRLGVYYLVGAFIAGVAAQRFRSRIPSLGSSDTIRAVEVFASFFVPFYFFSAGSHVTTGDLDRTAFTAAAMLCAIVIPIRVLAVALQRRLSLGEGFGAASRVGLPLVPTLVFTLVLAGIARDMGGGPAWLFGALALYAVVSTLIPGLVLDRATPDPDVALSPAE